LPASGLELFWAVVAVTGVFCLLAIAIAWLAIVHNRRIRNSEARFLLLLYGHHQRISESEARFRLLFDRAFDPVVLVDGQTNIKNCNQAFCNLVGQSHGQLLGAALCSSVAPNYRKDLEAELAKSLASGLDFLGDLSIILADGKAGQVEAGASCLTIDGRQYLLVSFRDIQTRKRIEDELKRKNAAMKELLAYLKAEERKYKRDVESNIEESVIPLVHHIANSSRPPTRESMMQLEKNLRDVVKTSRTARDAYKRLSPREIEICNLIRSGALSKDIAETLNVSELTVHKHRERIRKKLGIVNTEESLISFLRKY
jgi:PAS domain S-box-containing protein